MKVDFFVSSLCVLIVELGVANDEVSVKMPRVFCPAFRIRV